MPTTNEIVVEIQSDKPFGSRNLIHSRLKAIKNTTAMKIRSKRLVFIGKKPLRGAFCFAIISSLTPLPHRRLVQ